VFGKVVSGQDVIDTMENQRSDKSDRPHALVLSFILVFFPGLDKIHAATSIAALTPSSELRIVNCGQLVLEKSLLWLQFNAYFCRRQKERF
jgi:hypothetical protein